jgi:hypothetical protein
MMETKDYVSGLIGLVLIATGALPLLNAANVGPPWFALSFLPLQLFAYILAGAGFYLAINSIIEITNSNSIGWISFLFAVVVLAAGVLQVLSRFSIGPGWFELSFISQLFYNILFVLEGILLMIAMFAMEL